jgi:uncharacterized protein
MAAAVRLKPEVDATNAFYWEGLRHNRLLIQRCSACARRRFPPMPSCPYCAATDAVVEQASDGASLYSWIVVHRPFDPSFADQVPYTLGTVDLDGGGRLVARIVNAPTLAAGMELSLHIHQHDDWAEPQFAPAEGWNRQNGGHRRGRT